MLLAARLAPTSSRRIARSAVVASAAAAAIAAVPAAIAAVPARCFSSARGLVAPRCSRLIASSPAAAASSSLLPRRAFASITLTPTTAREFDGAMTAFLDCCLLLLESPRFERHNLDLTLADGVLSVASPEAGTWVLNKHGPTRQIWLSSPLSGPRKFNLHWEAETAGATQQQQTPPAVGEGWLGERDTSDSLKARLISEWSEAFGVTIDPVADFPAEHK